MQVGDVMTHHPVCIPVTSDLHSAAELAARSGVSDLMVVDGKLVGVVARADVCRAVVGMA